MKSTIICGTTQLPALPAALRSLLPDKVLAAVQQSGCRHIEELRLRIGYGCSISDGIGNCPLSSLHWSREDMDSFLYHACDGSAYALRSCMDNGYLPLCGGVRIGVCGCAGENNAADGARIRRVDSVNIRIPARFPAVGRGLFSIVRACFPRGVLIYAPPAVGKTTLLRSLADFFSKGEQGMRVALVDSRRELDDGAFAPHATLDILSGYPKREGIEIAVRTLSAQLIICDELGSKEARAVLSAALCGVPLIASAHAANLRQLLARPEMRLLHGVQAFGCYVGLMRARRGEDYVYTITPWDEVSGI
jgi:stage III sporulation protein AA